ncbi:MAG: transcriptional regulator [Candidatus Thermoplasmatota archaeon]|nr:transcriptional regulator [Candidatus Thermoplasmatota archaeon]MBU1940968.1 transcriptional regulator [Candidatus Thermoplasmatota archaeon]
MDRATLLQETRNILSQAGFYVSDLYALHLSGFDLVARRDDTLLIVKILTNVDALSEEFAEELKTLSSVLKAGVILIGNHDGEGILEDNVIYYRFGIPALTNDTLQNHLLEGMPLTAYAGPGGLYINIDEKKLRRIRQERNISLGSFARHVKVSRRTVQMYEDGMNARLDIAYRIEELLQTSITQPFELIHRHYHRETPTPSLPTTAVDKFREFELEIFKMLQEIGYKIIPVGKCPFDAFSKDRQHILLTCIQEYNQRLLQRAEIMSSLARIIERNAVLITDKETTKHNLSGTPLITRHEFKKINDPDDVLKLIRERQLDH